MSSTKLKRINVVLLSSAHDLIESKAKQNRHRICDEASALIETYLRDKKVRLSESTELPKSATSKVYVSVSQALYEQISASAAAHRNKINIEAGLILEDAVQVTSKYPATVIQVVDEASVDWISGALLADIVERGNQGETLAQSAIKHLHAAVRLGSMTPEAHVIKDKYKYPHPIGVKFGF